MGLDFVFLDSVDRPYFCRKWGDELWIFYWHIEQHWVSFREVTESEASLFPRNLLPSEQQLYHDLHAKWQAAYERPTQIAPELLINV